MEQDKVLFYHEIFEEISERNKRAMSYIKKKKILSQWRIDGNEPRVGTGTPVTKSSSKR